MIHSVLHKMDLFSIMILSIIKSFNISKKDIINK